MESKFIFIILLFLSFFYSSYVLKNSDFVFEVRLDVIPLNETSNIGSSSISTINQILGISSNQTDTQLSLYKSLIKSSSIAQILANDIDFVKKLAGESWDSKNNSIRKSKKTSLIKLKSLIKSFFGIPEYETDNTILDLYYHILIR